MGGGVSYIIRSPCTNARMHRQKRLLQPADASAAFSCACCTIYAAYTHAATALHTPSLGHPYLLMHILHRCTRRRTYISIYLYIYIPIYIYLYIYTRTHTRIYIRCNYDYGGGRRRWWRRWRETCVIKFILSKTSAILSRRI